MSRGRDPARRRVHGALVRLLRRGDDNAFVVIEESVSGKWVQVGKGSLNMDMPFIALTPEEIERAYHFFARLGEGPREYDAPDQPTCKGHHGVTFFYDFGKAVGAATNAVLAFFAEVYRLPSDVVLRTKEW